MQLALSCSMGGSLPLKFQDGHLTQLGAAKGTMQQAKVKFYHSRLSRTALLQPQLLLHPQPLASYLHLAQLVLPATAPGCRPACDLA